MSKEALKFKSMRMKKFIPIMVVGAILATTSLGIAQEKKEAKTGKKGPGIQQRVDRMAQELNLKDDQKTKVKALLEDMDKKRAALREDTSLSREQRQEKMRSMREDEQKKLKEILTPEQYDKWQKQMEANREKFKKGGQGKGKKNQPQ